MRFWRISNRLSLQYSVNQVAKCIFHLGSEDAHSQIASTPEQRLKDVEKVGTTYLPSQLGDSVRDRCQVAKC